MSAISVRITKEEFNYLLPVLKKHLIERGNGTYFCIVEDLNAMSRFMSRLQGVYGAFEETLPLSLVLACWRDRTILPFRGWAKRTANGCAPKTISQE